MNLRTPEAAARQDAHRIMVARIIKESSFEQILDLISEVAIAASGLGAKGPTIKQRRYARLGPHLGRALDAAILERI
jgi:hypothetical protein